MCIPETPDLVKYRHCSVVAHSSDSDRVAHTSSLPGLIEYPRNPYACVISHTADTVVQGKCGGMISCNHCNRFCNRFSPQTILPSLGLSQDPRVLRTLEAQPLWGCVHGGHVNFNTGLSPPFAGPGAWLVMPSPRRTCQRLARARTLSESVFTDCFGSELGRDARRCGAGKDKTPELESAPICAAYRHIHKTEVPMGGVSQR